MDYSEEIENLASEQRDSPNENPLSQKNESFILVKDSKKIFSRQIAEDHGIRKIKISNNVSSGDGKQEIAENGKVSQILELELKSLGLWNFTGFEVFIKSKHNNTNFLCEDESFCSNSEYYDAEDDLSNFDKANSSIDASPCINSLHKTSFEVTPINNTELSSEKTQTEKEFESSNVQTIKADVTKHDINMTDLSSKQTQTEKEFESSSVQTIRADVTKHDINITDLSSKQTQTEKEFESSSAQTTRVDVTYPEEKQKATTQTDQKYNVSTSTEDFEPSRETAEIQTESIPKKQVSLQTDTERITGTSQTETAAIFSIERTYDGSSQTDEFAEATTSTDFNIYIVDRTKISEKSTDTDDLPYVPLMVATKEKVEANDLSINTTDSCRKECRCILSSNDSEHNDYPNLATTNGAMQGETQFCFEKFRRKIDSLLKENMPESYRISETDLEDSKLPTPPVFLKLAKVDYNSITLKDKFIDHSKVEIIKHMTSAFNQREIFVAVQVQSPTKFEKAAFFTVPVVIQHFLNEFNMSAHKTHKVVINPITISTEINKSPDSRLERDIIKYTSMPSPTERCTKQAQALGIFDVTKGKSVVVLNIPNMMSTEDEHSQVCLCDSCYNMVQNVIERKRQHFEKNSELSPPRLDDKLKGNGKANITVTPKVRSKNFDYSTRDAWESKECSKEEVFREKVDAIDIIPIHDSYSDSNKSIESTENMNLHTACETVNDHLLNLRQVDEGSVKRAAQTLRSTWFEIVSSKNVDLEAVKFYIRYFDEFSINLLKTILHSTDSKGNNILHYAFANNRFDLVEELLDSGHAVELLKKTNQTGNSPLMVCSISLPKTSSDWSVVRRSFETGDVDGRSLKSGQTPLMNAASCGYGTMVNLLLEVGANPNLQDKDGSTALMYAAEHGQDRCAKMLMRHKACDPTIKDEDGQTACSIALSNGHKNVAVLIHMLALEKRQLSKNPHSTKRYVWTSSDSETETTLKSHSVHS